MPQIDAHCHFHFPEIAPVAAEFLAAQSDGYRCVCNGTDSSDWEDVAGLAQRNSSVIPAFGVHPWNVPAEEDFESALATLRQRLVETPGSQVGEIGLDRWIDGYDIEQQKRWFLGQYSLAAELGRPVTIHCLRAWGLLLETISRAAVHPPSMLLHAYSGPEDWVRRWSDMGAYFSFSTYFLGERKSKQREAFRCVPLDRLLVETDAPSMCPLDDVTGRMVVGEKGNHPVNLGLAYAGLAQLRGMSVEVLTEQVEQNFRAFCGEG